MNKPYTFDEIASVCDHTELGIDAKPSAIDALCESALKFRTASVCVRPHYVKRVASNLQGSGVAVCTVIGFPDYKWPDYMPRGFPTTDAKLAESDHAISDGAEELDIVANPTFLMAGQLEQYRRELRLLIRAAQAHGIITKVIFENCFVPDVLKRMSYEFAVAEGADFLKTSTGMGMYGSTVEDLKLMRQVAGMAMGVKAAGGISPANYMEHLLAMKCGELTPLNPKTERIGESSLLSKLVSESTNP